MILIILFARSVALDCDDDDSYTLQYITVTVLYTLQYTVYVQVSSHDHETGGADADARRAKWKARWPSVALTVSTLSATVRYRYLCGRHGCSFARVPMHTFRSTVCTYSTGIWQFLVSRLRERLSSLLRELFRSLSK